MTKLNEDKKAALVLLRIRGSVAISKELEYVFQLFHINRKNHATIIEGTPSYLGMIHKIKDYATWGEASSDTISMLLKDRGFVRGNKKLTEDYVKENLGYNSIDELSEAIAKSKINFTKLPNIKPVLRLHPPKGGFNGSTKKPYPEGELGYRGEKINKLIREMV
jgi:large subunit ribosomal protein L30